MRSNDAELTVIPSITITKQPVGTRTSIDDTTEFSVEASISDTRYTIEYYWTVDDIIQSNSNSTKFYVSSPTTGNKKVRAYAKLTLVSIDGRTDEGEPITVTNTVQASSDEVDWEIGPPRSIIRFEGFTPTGGYKFVDANLDDGDFTLDDSVFDSTYNVVTYYAREKNLKLTLHMDGAPGSDHPPEGVHGGPGGEGGRSEVVLDHDRRVEHTVLGTTNNSAVFLYRGSRLLLVTGQGGDGGYNKDRPGGAGGGVNVQGGDYTQPTYSDPRLTNSKGGALIPPGELTLDGIFGSTMIGATIDLQGNDIIQERTDYSSLGGRTISCTKGSYWIEQGISPCENNSASLIKFRIADGTEVTSSDDIIRGFKPGYTVIATEGRGDNITIKKGGRGATGGDGATGRTNKGGGGGSGYTDGTATILRTQLGGVPRSEKAKIKFSLIVPELVTVGEVHHHYQWLNGSGRGFADSIEDAKTKTYPYGHILDYESSGAVVDFGVGGDMRQGVGDAPYENTIYGAKGTFNEAWRHYDVTMNTTYSSINVEVIGNLRAANPSGTDDNMKADKIEQLDSLRWRIWFRRGNNNNITFVRRFRVTGIV